MCFNGQMSAAFAVLGLFSSWWVYSRTSNTELASGIFFFFTMEFLQAVQYVFIASGLNDHTNCGSFINKFLTLLGFLHICLQPYFCHVINCSLTKSCKYKDRYRIIKRLCLIGGFLLFSRYFLSFIPQLRTMHFNARDCQGNPVTKSTEWLRGDTLCTFKTQTMWHLGWSVPMADPSYYVVGASIHSFLMFAPFLVLYEKKGMILQGLFLFLFGPVLASVISDNLMEQASIWCFFSIAQISIMLFLIRETLIVNWGRDGTSHNISVFRKNQQSPDINQLAAMHEDSSNTSETTSDETDPDRGQGNDSDAHGEDIVNETPFSFVKPKRVGKGVVQNQCRDFVNCEYCMVPRRNRQERIKTD